MLEMPWITADLLQYSVVSISIRPVPTWVAAVKGLEPVANDILHTKGAITSVPERPYVAPTEMRTGYMELMNLLGRKRMMNTNSMAKIM